MVMMVRLMIVMVISVVVVDYGTGVDDEDVCESRC